MEGAEEKVNKHLYTLPSDPYGSSERVSKLLITAGIDEALDFVIHLPLDLQSTVVWNQLIGYCSKHGKDKTAKSIFVQMRKRGIKPNERTFSHLLSTLRKSSSPTSVKRAEEWIEIMYQRYHMLPTTYHYNILLNCYIDNELYNQVVAKVRQMIRDHSNKYRVKDNNSDTLLLPVPDQVTLSTALNICPLVNNQPLKEVRRIYQHILDRLNDQLERKENGNDKNKQTKTMASTPSSSSSSSTLQEKALQLMKHDSILLQDQQELKHQQEIKELLELKEQQEMKEKKELEKLIVDDVLIVALFKCLSRLYSQQYKQSLKKVDHVLKKEVAIEFGQDIMSQLYGIHLDSSSSSPSPSSSSFGLTPTVKVLDSVVRYFGTLRQFHLGEAYYHSILNTYPDVIPDQQAKDALAWMQSNHKKLNKK
ncbi:unnamed protein product [Cunninghamella echinulata]